MHQFFVESGQIREKQIVITGPDVKHIKNVLRMKVGEELSVSNGEDGREYRCKILELLEDQIICELLFIKESGQELPNRITLFQGLPKSDKMEFIIQKAVELGAAEIVPVTTRRSIVKWDEKKSKNKIERWQGIAEAAAKQSKRSIVPVVSPVMTIKEAISHCAQTEVKMIPYELAEGMEQTRALIEGIRKGQSIAVFIGPEGGFEEEEIKIARDGGVIPVTMGKRILRTETAGMTMLAWLMYRLEG